MKLLITLSLLLTINTLANETEAPSQHYTELKNSTYLATLEKQRLAAVHQREARVDVREYMRYKRANLK